MQRLEVAISTDYIALNDLLKVAGIVESGGQGKQLVASGVVSVNGCVEYRKTNKIYPGMTVLVDGQITIDVAPLSEEEPSM